MNEPIAYFITWTTYGTWLPGDNRGWRSRKSGPQLPESLLEDWCRRQMRGEAVLLRPCDREVIEQACCEHARYREWALHAVNARTNHVHVVLAANESPQKVRDQLKANCTRSLRNQPNPLQNEKTWTKGGDCAVLYSDEELDAAVLYVLEGQDKSN